MPLCVRTSPLNFVLVLLRLAAIYGRKAFALLDTAQTILKTHTRLGGEDADDGDGTVSRKEFHQAMPLLGFDVPKFQVDNLFDSFDADGSGTIEYDELRKVLQSASTSPSKSPEMRKKSSASPEKQKAMSEKAPSAMNGAAAVHTATTFIATIVSAQVPQPFQRKLSIGGFKLM